MPNLDPVGTFYSLQEQWDHLSKPSKQAIYGVIAAVPSIGFALLAAYLNNDARPIFAITSATFGAASVGFFTKSACNYRQQLVAEESRLVYPNNV